MKASIAGRGWGGEGREGEGKGGEERERGFLAVISGASGYGLCVEATSPTLW